MIFMRTCLPSGLSHQISRRVIPFRMSRTRRLFITFPSNMLKFSPSSFRVMVWVSATFKIVCFSSTRPWSFSA